MSPEPLHSWADLTWPGAVYGVLGCHAALFKVRVFDHRMPTHLRQEDHSPLTRALGCRPLWQRCTGASLIVHLHP